MTIPCIAEASPGPKFLPAGADTGQPLIKGSEVGHLPDGAAIVMVRDSSGKKVDPLFPAQTRVDTVDGTEWRGALHLGDKVDPGATYKLLHPAPVHLWLIHQEAN